mgnify:CR=1 FL=1
MVGLGLAGNWGSFRSRHVFDVTPQCISKALVCFKHTLSSYPTKCWHFSITCFHKWPQFRILRFREQKVLDWWTRYNYLSRLHIYQNKIQALKLKSYYYCLVNFAWGTYLNILFAMDYIVLITHLRLEVTDVAKPSAININEFAEINEFISLLEFKGNLFRNLLKNCLGNKVVESSCISGQFTLTKIYAKGCY